MTSFQSHNVSKNMTIVEFNVDQCQFVWRECCIKIEPWSIIEYKMIKPSE